MLGDRTPADFLRDHWQTRPLVVPDALPDFRSPLSPEELAGLACEDSVQSRLILKDGGAHPWELRHGPFDAEAFGSLPESHWTLLVQEVDRLVPEVGALLERFDFLPRWRIDDVMVSYAPTGGTVGPHVDNYDVFLIQGAGHRRWEIGHAPVEDESIVPDRDVRMLADFSPDATHVLGPGDLLYLPPRVAHHGVATDDACMTYSVGFRAPTHRDLIANFLQHAMETVDPDARFHDPNRAPTAHPGALPDADCERVRMLLRTLVADDDALDRWFGRFVTRPSRDRVAVPPDEPWAPEALAAALRDGAALWHGTASRLAFAEGDGSGVLFANGSAYPLDASTRPLAPLLCDCAQCPGADLVPHLDAPSARTLLAALVNDGVLDVLPASA
jgi:50S ribosomal protein L16 3-hydroxylase